MNIRDLIPWSHGSEKPLDFFHDDKASPFLTLQREMNRLLDEAFRGLDMPALLGSRQGYRSTTWPRIEATETEKEICVAAEIPGLDENDVELMLTDGTLIIRGEKKSMVEDKDRQFTECFHGRFERQISLGMDVEEDRVEAEFKNGILKITLPKSEKARAKAKRIAINAQTKH